MIGQQALINTLQSAIEDNKLPQFIIIAGAKGSGKKTLVREYIKPYYDCLYVVNNKVESIRGMIETAYIVHNKVFLLFDVDNMSLSAKNALLKVIEDCPNNNRFVMTIEDENNTLETIRSRAVVYHMDSYTHEEIQEFAESEFIIERCDYIEIPIVHNLCDTPGEVLLLNTMGINEFYSYVQKVVENISDVSGANAFKIADKISFKEDDEGYDLKLFWKAFMSVCITKFRESKKVEYVTTHAKWAQITSKYLRDLNIVGINKRMLFDAWILEIREVVIWK